MSSRYFSLCRSITDGMLGRTSGGPICRCVLRIDGVSGKYASNPCLCALSASLSPPISSTNLLVHKPQSANNIVGHSKRAFASAIVVGSGGVGGIMATTIFRQADAPKYIPGIWTVIGLQVGVLLVVGGSSLWFTKENAKTRKDRKRLIEGQEGFFYTI